jgi:hypothetical protein
LTASYVTHPLPFYYSQGQAFLSEMLNLKNLDGSESRKVYRITMTYVGTIIMPEPTVAAWKASSGDEVRKSACT